LVVKTDLLRERLAALRATIERLRVLRGRDATDPAAEWAVERGLQIAAQSIFDIGNHVLSGGFGDRPAEYAQIPARLAQQGVISDGLSAKLQGLAGFRNLLVHDYARVDPARVQALLRDRLDDLLTFTEEVEQWLDDQPST
jgi:uncharacterized protein YutE (UPF0331/DUF86 family)